MLSTRPMGLPLDADRGVPMKTPGHALAKTRNILQENAVRNVPMTIVGKGRKAVQNTPLQSKTLQTDRVLKDHPGKQVGPSKTKDTPTTRPLGDKTPFPNRNTNQPSVTGAKLALIDASLRPSSARKHDRLPRSASKVFETPITNGKHWDVSDIEIEVDAPVANKSIEEECHDEIEYMPPKVEDIPYEPPFEMPNYREVGKTLMALIRSYTIEDDPPSTDLTFIVDPSERNFFAQPVLPQPELGKPSHTDSLLLSNASGAEDDSPFARAKPEPEMKPQTSNNSKERRAVSNKPTSRLATQTTMLRTRTNPLAKTQSPPVVRRSPTTSSAHPPTTTRTSSSQPLTRAPTSQSTMRAPSSRATTRAPSAARSTPPVRAGVVARPPRAPCVSRLTVKPAAPTTQVKATKVATTRPNTRATPATRNAVASSGNTVSSSNSPNAGRPRSGTITKAAFESNTHTHIVAHMKANSLEDVKKDLEGLIVFEDAFDDDDGFQFDV